jgi:hypothetical protein
MPPEYQNKIYGELSKIADMTVEVVGGAASKSNLTSAGRHHHVTKLGSSEHTPSVDYQYPSLTRTVGRFVASHMQRIRDLVGDAKFDRDMEKTLSHYLREIAWDANRLIQIDEATGRGRDEAGISTVLLDALALVATGTQVLQMIHVSVTTNLPLVLGQALRSQNIGNAKQAATRFAIALNAALTNPDPDKLVPRLSGAILTKRAERRRDADPSTTYGSTTIDDVSDLAAVQDTGDEYDNFLRRITFDLFPEFIRACIEKHVPVPIDFDLPRPHMTYDAASGIFMKRGLETGATYFGSADLQLSNEGYRKALLGYFTCESMTMVVEKRNVHVIHNIWVTRYHYGAGVELYDNNSQSDRMNYAQADGGLTGGKSIFIIPMYPWEQFAEPYYDITGFYPDGLRAAADGVGKASYILYSQMCDHWGWRRRAQYFNTDFHVHEQQAFNTIVFQGHQFMPKVDNGVTAPRGYHKVCAGHWGDNCYQGVGRHRLGQGKIQPVDWSLRGSTQI